ncbi:MAG: hypothetical protein EOP04_16045, partial [Proteobacteria bacterium]
MVELRNRVGIALLIALVGVIDPARGESEPCSALMIEYVRFPEEPVLDPVKLAQLAAQTESSIQTVFAPAVRDGRIIDHFKEVILDQHRVLADNYSGHLIHSKTGRNVSRPAAAGFFVNYDYLFEKRLIAPEWNELRLDFMYAKDARIHNSYFRDLFAQWKVKERSVKIEHTPPEWLPKNTWDSFPRNSLVHFYPAVTHLDHYLYRMSELMKIVVHPPVEKYWIWHLSDYYHVGINAHPFVVANNSLMMSPQRGCG